MRTVSLGGPLSHGSEVDVTDEVTGRMVLRYGGDFDDRPSDYEFSGNGILFADRTEKPALQEVKYYYGKWQEK